MDRALETLVALASLYLFLSLLALAAVEAISSLIDLRARHLEKGIRALLDGKTEAVMNDPLLRSLARASGRKRPLPSYVPPEMFATAVIDAMAASRDAFTRLEREAPALHRLVAQAGDDAVALRRRIEAWFDAAMERVSGVYKRSIQHVTRLVAILLVLGLNADSFEVGQRVWNEPVARQGAVHYSQKLLELCQPDQDGRLRCPTMVESGGEAAGPYPLGWTQSKWQALGGVGDFVYKLIGLLVTVLAISLGAPFWFDVLRRVAPGLRQSGPKPASSASANPAPSTDPLPTPGASVAAAARLELVTVEPPPQPSQQR